MNTRYWIIGGEYTDTSFSTLVAGTEQVAGPFTTRERALAVWRRFAAETSSLCNARFTVAQEDTA